MSNIKALDRLVEFVSEDALLVEMVEAVEHEVAEKFCELPVDADGVLIHVGDMVQGLVDGGPVQHLELWDDGWVVVFEFAPGQFTRYSGDAVRHAKPRTLEDVLRDYACDFADSNGPDYDEEITRRYADEIRELMGVKE